MGYITVVGALNIDLIATSFEEPVPGDSSPGVVKMSAGGVGRNIARSLRDLGEEVQLIAPVSEDADGAFARADCAGLGISLDGALPVPSSCRYLCVNGPEGSLRLAVNDMAAMALLTPAELEARLPLINGSDLIVLDANLSEDALRFLAARTEKPLVADPVSAPKASRMRGILNRLTAIKPNRAEAAALTGLSPDDAPEALAAALLHQGVTHIYLSLGGDGMLYAGAEGTFTSPSQAVRAVNFNGCGDAATAVVAHALRRGLSPRETAALAMLKAAQKALEA
jgi:pseudouridine kinase